MFLQHFSNFEIEFYLKIKLPFQDQAFISKLCFSFEIEARFQNPRSTLKERKDFYLYHLQDYH